MQQKTIMVVDDSPLNIDVLVGILSQQYKVKAAISGATALRIAKRQLPDLILLDVVMPEMDGYEVLEHLRADSDTKGVPVVFVTGKSDEEDRQRGLELGAQGFLTKPVEPSQVIEMLDSLLK